MRRLGFPFSLLLLFAGFSAGCSSSGGEGGTGPSGTGGTLADVTPATSAPRALERVVLDGLPLARSTTTDYEVVFVDPPVSATIPVEVDDGGTAFFFAPFHPETPTVGGVVTMQVRTQGEVSPEFDLDLGALDDAPGAFAALTETLREHVDGFAKRQGSSLAELRASSFEETSSSLLPLRYAVSWIDDPANPNSFAAIAAGESDYLNDDERTLLDQITAHGGLAGLLDLEIDALADLEAPTLALRDDLSRRRDCVLDVGIEITNADQLSRAMWEAKFADIAISGDAGETLGALGGVLAGGSTIPIYGKAFTLGGAALTAWSASRGSVAGLYPSSFTAIDATVSKTRFEEDAEEPARWSDVRVTARSSGWTADKEIAESVLTVVGLRISAAQAGRISQSGILKEAAVSLANPAAGAYLSNQDGGLVEFCPQTWTVDISSPAWCEGRSVFGHFEVASGAQTYRPLAVEEDFLSISVRPEKFGQETIDKDFAIGVDAIEVVATPAEIVLDQPGIPISITADVVNAVDEDLFWDPGAGEWTDGLLELTNQGATRPMATPPSRGDYPYSVVIESISRKGLRASGTPRRFTTVTIRVDAPIVVEPGNQCLDNGEIQEFVARQNGALADVDWSLEDPAGGPSSLGFVSLTGVYTAPQSGSGQVLVVATSRDDPTNRAEVLVDVGVCSCYWELTIQGGGSWSGALAGHLFAPGLPFTINWEDQGGIAVGFAQIFAGAPGPESTGSFDVTNFGFQVGNTSWVTTAGDDGSYADLLIETNDGTSMEGSITGRAIANVGGELADFNMFFRSGNIGGDEGGCGEQ